MTKENQAVVDSLPENHSLRTAIEDLTGAIEDIFLGSIQDVVVDAAVNELIVNWNDHEPADRI